MVTKNMYGYEIPCKREHDCNTVMKLDKVNFGCQTGLRLIQGDNSIDIELPEEIAIAIAHACESIIAAQPRALDRATYERDGLLFCKTCGSGMGAVEDEPPCA